MAIRRFDGTTDGSNSGWKARFKSEVGGGDGHTYRVEIIDSGASAGTFSQSESTVTHFDLVGDDSGAFLLEYEGNTDMRHTSLVPSKFTIQILEETAAHGEIFTAVQNNVDNRFGLALFVFEPDENATGSTPSGADQYAAGNGYWRPMWFGTIMADQGEARQKNSPLRIMTLTAQCGLVLLNDEPFKPAGDAAYTDNKSMAVTLGRCFEKLPTASLWNGWNQYNGATTPSYLSLDENDVVRSAATDVPAVPLLRESVWIFDKSKHLPTDGGSDVPGGASVLRNTFVFSTSFLDVEKSEDNLGGTVRKRTYTSCGEVLQHCASIFGAQIFLSWGSWWFTNPDVHIAESDAGTDHRQHAWWNVAVLLSNTESGPISDPLDTRALSPFERGFDLLNDATETVLFPVKSVSSIHIEGGSRSLIRPTGTEFSTNNFEFGQIDPFKATRTANSYTLNDLVFSNSECVVPAGQILTMTGTISLAAMGTLIDSSYKNVRARGMKYRCNLTVKCGSQYLKRDITNRSETAPIKNSVGSTVATAKFFDQSGDVEWTTDVETYDFVLPRTTSDPPAATVILNDNGTTTDFEFVGGLHTERRSNDEGEFKATSGLANLGSGTIQHDSIFELAWTLPALPDTSDHTGLTITFDWKILDSDNQEILGGDLLDVIDITNNNSQHSVGDETAIGGVHNFHVVMGGGENNEDVEFVAQQTENVSRIVTCESVLGDKYDDTQQNRSVRVRDHSTGVISNPNENWVTCDNHTATGKFIHALRASEVLQKREKPVQILNATMAFTDKTATNLGLSNQKNSFSADAFTVLHFARPVLLKYANGVENYFHLLELKWTNQMVGMTLCKLSSARDITSITEANDSRPVRGPRPSGTATGAAPSAAGQPPTKPALDLQLAINKDEVTAVKEKTDLLTVSEALNLDTVADKVAPLTVNAGGTAFTNIPLEDNAIRADKLYTSASHRLISDTQLNSIASNALSVSSHTDSIADIEDKTDLLSITEQIDLDVEKGRIATNVTSIANNVTNISTVTGVANTANNRSVTNQSGVLTNFTNVATNVTNIATNVTAIAGNASDISSLQGDVNDIENALDLADNGASNRTGQSGVELATWTAAGVIDSIADGSTGQFLKTDGSGALSWAAAGGGWHGSTALMKVFPTEFMGNDVGRTLITPIIEDDTLNTLGVRVNSATGKLIAINEIPTGYKATHVQVYTDAAVSSGVEVYTFNQTTGAISSVGTGDTNASIDITDVTSTATAAIVIEVSPGSTLRLIFGADITISAT